MSESGAAQNCTPFRWDGRRERAAQLVADGAQTDAEIAGDVGVSRRQLATWKRHPTFAARVEEHLAAMRTALQAKGIAAKENRVDALNERWALLHQVIQQRGAWSKQAGAGDPKNLTADEWIAPGAETGLLVRTVRYTPIGKVVEWALDAAVLKELREHEKQAAIELGQWAEKREVTGRDGEALVITLNIGEHGNRDES